MGKHHSNSKELSQHIHHYWIIGRSDKVFDLSSPMYAYPGIRPELILVLEGHVTFNYQNQQYSVDKPVLFSHIQSEVVIDLSKCKSFIIIQFNPRSISSILPFVNRDAVELIKNGVQYAETFFDDSINLLRENLIGKEEEEIVNELDEYLFEKMDKNYQGYIIDLANENLSNNTLKEIINKTNYSYSTLERHFKKETGMSPKRYQSLRRYKAAVEEIYDTMNPDWLHYVSTYGYYDQSHFIREVKRYTSFTPAQLLKNHALRTYRPE